MYRFYEIYDVNDFLVDTVILNDEDFSLEVNDPELMIIFSLLYKVTSIIEDVAIDDAKNFRRVIKTWPARPSLEKFNVILNNLLSENGYYYLQKK